MAINHDTKAGNAMTDSFVDPFEGETGRKITPGDLAAALFISDKAVRARMRKMTEKSVQPGSGGRWTIEVGSERYFDLVKSLQSPTRNRQVSTF